MIYESELVLRVERVTTAVQKLVKAMGSDDPKIATAAKARFAAIEQVANGAELSALQN